jgi:hypothetical protein
MPLPEIANHFSCNRKHCYQNFISQNFISHGAKRLFPEMHIISHVTKKLQPELHIISHVNKRNCNQNCMFQISTTLSTNLITQKYIEQKRILETASHLRINSTVAAKNFWGTNNNRNHNALLYKLQLWVRFIL